MECDDHDAAPRNSEVLVGGEEPQYDELPDASEHTGTGDDVTVENRIDNLHCDPQETYGATATTEQFDEDDAVESTGFDLPIESFDSDFHHSSNPFDDEDGSSSNPFNGQDEDALLEHAESKNPFGNDEDVKDGYVESYHANTKAPDGVDDGRHDGRLLEPSGTKLFHTPSLAKAPKRTSKKGQIALREAAEALAATGYNPFGSTDDMDDPDRRAEVTKSLANVTIASFTAADLSATPEQIARKNYAAQLVELTTLGFDEIYSINALRASDGDVDKARKLLTAKIDDPMMSAHILSVWKSPVTLRIGGWLPNVQDELGAFHTAYYISVLMVLGNQSWRIGRRYSEFYALYCKIYPQTQKAFPKGMTHAFPVSRMGWLQGSSEALCNERRVQLDAWLKEVVSSSRVMLDDASRSHIFHFLEVEQNLKRLAQAASLVVSAAPSVAAGTSTISSRLHSTQHQKQRSGMPPTPPPRVPVDTSAIPSSLHVKNAAGGVSSLPQPPTNGTGASAYVGAVAAPAPVSAQAQSGSSTFNWFMRRTTAGATATAATSAATLGASSVGGASGNVGSLQSQSLSHADTSLPATDPSSFTARRLKSARPMQS